MWQIQRIKWGGPRLIQEARSVYLLGTAPSTQHAGDVYRLVNPKRSRVIHSRDVKWTGKHGTELQGMLTQMKIFDLKKKIKILMKKSQSLKKMIQMLLKLVNHKQKEPQLEWQMMSKWLQGQEAKLQQMNQLQQEQEKHLGQSLK